MQKGERARLCPKEKWCLLGLLSEHYKHLYSTKRWHRYFHSKIIGLLQSIFCTIGSVKYNLNKTQNTEATEEPEQEY